MKTLLRLVFVVGAALAVAQPALAQAPAASQNGGWDVAIYPVLGWLPLGIDIDVSIPPVGGGGGGDTNIDGGIIDGRFDGAFFGGLSAQKGKFRIDADGLWAAVGGDRPDRPFLRADVDVIYAHGSVGYAVRPGLFVTGGVRRMALKLDVDIADRHFEAKPGLWDPLVGFAYHSPASGKLQTHAFFEGGGFGVGTDVDISTGIRFDYKPVSHFGITAGYNFMYFKVTDEVLTRTFVLKQTLHGPTLGIGFYF